MLVSLIPVSAARRKNTTPGRAGVKSDNVPTAVTSGQAGWVTFYGPFLDLFGNNEPFRREGQDGRGLADRERAKSL